MTSRRSVCFLLFAAASLSAPRLVRGATPAWKAELRKKLAERISVSAEGIRWDKALALWERAAKCKVVVDNAVPRGRLVMFRLHGVPAARVLDWLCYFADSGWLLADGAVAVCPADRVWARQPHLMRRYDLRLAVYSRREAKRLTEVVDCFLTPPFRAFRGPGGKAILEPHDRMAVIAPEQYQRAIARMVEALKTQAPNQSARWQGPRPRIRVTGPPKSPLLGGPAWWAGASEPTVTFDLIEAPLKQVFAAMWTRREANIVFDLPAWRDEQPTVTLKVNQMRAGAAFNWVLMLTDGVVLTTQDGALITRAAQAGSLEPQADTLVVHDLTGVLAEGWTRGEVRACLEWGEARHGDACALVGTKLAVSAASARWRAFTDQLVAAMRAPKDAPSKGIPWDAEATKPASRQPAWQAALEKKLQTRISLAVDGAPLAEILQQLARLTGAPVVLASRLAQQRPPAPWHTVHLHAVPATVALDYVCRMAKVRWTLADQAVLVCRARRKQERPRAYRIWGVARTPAEARLFAKFALWVTGQYEGNDAAESYGIVPGYHLVVWGSECEQRFVEQLCRALRELGPGQWRALPRLANGHEPPGLPAWDVADAMPRAVATRLNAVAEVEMDGMPPRDAVARIASLAKTTLILDPDEAFAGPEVTLQAKRMRLADALGQVAEQLGVAVVPLEHGLLLCSKERARRLRPCAWVVYDVRGLAADEPAAAGLAVKLEAAGKAHKDWLPWHFVARWRRRLVVRTAPATHAKIHELITRSARN